MLKEFKEFATRGNIMDMAIGVIIGGAFQKIVTSLVNDIIMPTVAIFTGKVDFSDLVFTVGSASIKYGAFITAIIDFLIIAFSIFIAIKVANSINKRMEKIAKGELDKINKKTKKLLKNKRGRTGQQLRGPVRILHGQDHVQQGMDNGWHFRGRRHHRHVHEKAHGIPSHDSPVQAEKD